jgi:hypothetical protein
MSRRARVPQRQIAFHDVHCYPTPNAESATRAHRVHGCPDRVVRSTTTSSPWRSDSPSVPECRGDVGARAGALRDWQGGPTVLCQTVLVGVAHSLGAVAGAGLVEDPVDVGLDGGAAEDELVCDLAVRQAGGDQLEYLDLA